MKTDDQQEGPQRTEIYCWTATDVGRVRASNEDSYCTSGQLDLQGGERWEGSLGSHAWAVVADGMGGHAGGKVASALAIECLSAMLPKLTNAEEIRSAIEETNLALYHAMNLRPDLRGMGTTIAGISAGSSFAMLFNVGDSRVYAYAEGELVRLSEDHVVDGNMLTKCLGGANRPATVGPFVREIELTGGSRYLLCTDGLTDEVDDEEIADLLELEQPADKLLAAALLSGGRDNVTVLVLEVEVRTRIQSSDEGQGKAK